MGILKMSREQTSDSIFPNAIDLLQKNDCWFKYCFFPRLVHCSSLFASVHLQMHKDFTLRFSIVFPVERNKHQEKKNNLFQTHYCSPNTSPLYENTATPCTLVFLPVYIFIPVLFSACMHQRTGKPHCRVEL